MEIWCGIKELILP
jgi:WD40 repeat protein